MFPELQQLLFSSLALSLPPRRMNNGYSTDPQLLCEVASRPAAPIGQQPRPSFHLLLRARILLCFFTLFDARFRSLLAATSSPLSRALSTEARLRYTSRPETSFTTASRLIAWCSSINRITLSALVRRPSRYPTPIAPLRH